MFIFLNRIFKKLSSPGKYFKNGTSSGQVAIVLILVAAIGLVFYAVTLNFGRISQVKTLTMIAANNSASTMGSLMMSYGESVLQQQLGGEIQKCGLSGVFKAIIGVLAAIAAVIITIASGGTAAPIVASLLALVVSGIALTLQITVVNPGITDMWNRIVSESLTIEDQFIEQGLTAGLRNVITDQAQVPDIIDMDSDTFFGGLTNSSDPNSAPDYVSRFGFYNLERVRQIASLGGGAINVFVDTLRDFIYKGSDDWGLHDPVSCVSTPLHGCCQSPPVSAMCDPCCVDGSVVTLPACCTDATSPNFPCGDSSSCNTRSPYGGDYKYVYDVYYENDQNIFFSFREEVGRDDEHHLYRVNPAAPLQTDPQILDGAPLPLNNPDRFKLEDTSGFYPEDMREGIFPFFYKTADWGTELSALTYAGEQCHWCADAGASCTVPDILVLPNPPGTYNGGECVDNANTGSAGDPPQLADKVPSIPSIFEADNNCAVGVGTPTETGWKRGADRFCSTTWPYAEECAKHGSNCKITLEDGTEEPVDCECSEGDARTPEWWQDDNLDQIVYGLGTSFLPWAEEIINSGSLIVSFAKWYPDAAEWIEPACPGCPAEGCPGENPPCCTCEDSYTKKERAGRLYIIRDQLRSFSRPIKEWIFPPGGYVGTGCNSSPSGGEVWCVPPAQGVQNEYNIHECSGVNPNEAATFDFNGNGTRGDLADVVACLDWNANDTVTYADATEATGNAEKFAACRDDCSADKCATLPRSLVPNFGSVLPFNPAPGGSCDDTAPGGFIARVTQSAEEAENQVAKLKKRYDFLSARLGEAQSVSGVLDEAIDKFTAFLDSGTPFDTPGPGPDGVLGTADDSSQDSPAELLIEARQDLAPGLASVAVYAWQDILDPPKMINGLPSTEGDWHIVKVETRVPTRCNSACGVAGGTDPPWPRVKTYTKGFLGSKRCHELEVDPGMVKSRVTRYDQDRDSSALRFPDGTPIWNIRFFHPGKERADPGNLAAICDAQIDPRLKNAPWSNAFMLGKVPDADAGYRNCWEEVHRLLATGVTSETCAQYSFNGSFNLNFVDCDAGFQDGTN